MTAVLSIAIGVVFVFLTFSLVISGVHEAIVALTSLRSKVLWTTLQHFADSENNGRTSRLTLKQFSKLLAGVRSADPRPKGSASGAQTDGGGQAFLDSVHLQTQRFESGTRRSRLKDVSPTVISRAVLELGGDMATIAQADAAKIGTFLAKIEARVAGTQLERPVKAAIAEAGGDIDRFRSAIETWFDARMKALSSLYKMWSRWIMLALAIGLAFAVDVNPIVTVDLLRKDSALAEATVDQALAFAKAENLPVTGCPTADSTPPTTVAGSAAASTPADPLAQCYQSLRNSVARTRSLPPPLAFDHFGKGSERTWQYLIGCLIGAVAISFGAPFWYDVLRRLIAARR
jgi:hypothetical protein